MEGLHKTKKEPSYNVGGRNPLVDARGGEFGTTKTRTYTGLKEGIKKKKI